MCSNHYNMYEWPIEFTECREKCLHAQIDTDFSCTSLPSGAFSLRIIYWLRELLSGPFSLV